MSRHLAVSAACVASVVAVAAPIAMGRESSRADKAAATPIYLDSNYSFAERAADLVARMTPAEKASQLDSSVAPAIPRLGVQQFGWWNEALHGVSRLQYLNGQNATTLTNTTSYPIDQSLGSSWDPDLVYKVASNISDEAREVAPNNSLNLDFYSPTMNLERDPRWGRNDETYGEDPLLVSKEVDQFVNGMEGKDESGKLLTPFHKTVTTIKHDAANNSEVNRRTGSSDMDDRTLREYYTKAFRDVVQDSQPGSVMSSYNSINGTPTAADPYLMDNLMRETFGFAGYFTSDCDAIYEIVAGHHWQPPNMTRPVNNTERHAYAMSAGEDLDCNAGYKDAFNYGNQVPAAVNEQIPTLTDTFNANDEDQALVRLFTARMELGEFDDPATVPWIQQARARVPQGTWTNADTNNAVTETPARLNLAREAGDKSIVLLKNSAKVLPLNPPASGPYKVLVVGYFAHPSSMYLGGYSSTQGPAGTANNVDGYTGIKNAITAINPAAQVDYMKGFTGTGTTAASLTTVDPAAVAAASGYNAVIVYAGTDAGTATEDIDRAAITLPGAQSTLINQVAAVNPNTAVYMETIGPIDVSSFEPNVSAILWSSYNGQRKGDSLADVLLGTYDPSGHLPSTWYHDVGQLPPVTDYNLHPTATTAGRTYMYFNGSTQYPFGYGLSYTTFGYSNLQIDNKTPGANDTIKVSVDVTNTGTVAGVAVPQLYVSEPDAPAALQRPLERLEGFQKVSLAPGAKQTVTFTLKVADLAFSDSGKWVIDDGRNGIKVGSSSADAAVQDTITVTGALAPKPSVVTVKPVASDDAARGIQTRVMFPTGATVNPQVTVAMTDDSLYGYIDKGQSKDLPSEMTVSYATDRPSVLSVSGNVVRAVAPGVATLTTSVTAGGVTKTVDSTIDVVSEATSLTLDGQPLTTFHPDTYSYDVVVPDGQATAPVLAVTADSSATVAVTQASALPGTAAATVTGADGTTYTYKVNLAHYAKGDEFNGALGPQWTAVRPNPAALSTTPTALAITAEAGDLQTTTNTAKNLVLQNAPGDWTVESKLDFSVAPHFATQSGGIMAYQDDDNYLRLAWEFSANAARITETEEDNQSGTAINQVLANVPTTGLTGKTVYFRMSKKGNRYASYYSTDGSTWTLLYETGQALTNVKVGPYAFNRAGTSSDLTVNVDYFRLDTSAPVTSPVGGTVPATLALTLGTPASFGAFIPGVARDYAASTTANVISTAGDATLSVADPSPTATGHLVNGSFSLPSPLLAGGSPLPAAVATWASPVSNTLITIPFTQHIGANDALRTGSYSKTLTFTLSTTTP